MTSSERTRPWSTLLWCAVVIVIALGALYTAAWFTAAHFAEKRGRIILSTMAKAGRSAACADRRVVGFPLHFGIACKSVRYDDSRRNVTVTAKAMTASTPLYDPFHLEADFHGPATLSDDETGALAMNWKTLRGAMEFDLKRPVRATIEARALAVERPPKEAEKTPLLALDSLAGAAKSDGNDLDVSADFSGLMLGALPQMQDLPPLHGSGSLRVVDGADILGTGLRSLRNRHIYIEHLEIDPGSNGKADIAGVVSFNDEGLANGTLRVSVTNPDALSAVLSQAFPDSAGNIQTAFGLLGALGANPVLPVELHKGRIIVGFFKVGRLPVVK